MVVNPDPAAEVPTRNAARRSSFARSRIKSETWLMSAIDTKRSFDGRELRSAFGVKRTSQFVGGCLLVTHLRHTTTDKKQSPRWGSVSCYAAANLYLPRSVSLMPPTAFCILPFTWSPLPLDSSLESPNTPCQQLPSLCPWPVPPNL
jgi:hypothetical protein